MENPISVRIGISACLLGENVRYDGGNKLDLFLRDTLGRFVEYVPVCPEVECGLGVPREAMHLRNDSPSPRLVTIHTNQDMTDRMVSWARKRVVELEREDLRGFIFKSGSPSCGMEGAPVYDKEGVLLRRGEGLFARAFMELFPLLPVEEDGRLHDPALREKFMKRVFALKPVYSV
jgi:uncharacterized protein YbbK (DUF523 family)